MIIIEKDWDEMKSNWSYKLAVELLFKTLSETDRKNVWADGEYYSIGGKYYLAYNSINGVAIDKPIGCLVATKTVIVPKSKLQSSRDVDCLTLFVHPKYRNRNVGTWLVERAMRKSKSRLFMAKVKRDNRASLNLFNNLGFYEMNEKHWEWLACPEHKILLGDA